MPFHSLNAPRTKKVTGASLTPFSLIPLTIDVNSTSKFVEKFDFDCGCPCNNLVPQQFITSSNLMRFSNLTNAELTPVVSSHPENHQAVKVSVNSYLFKNILPPTAFSQGQFDPTGSQTDPSIPIYGLNVPILLGNDSGFLQETNKTDKSTLKIWLTCCYSAGITIPNPSDPPSTLFQSCAGIIDNGDTTISCDYKGIMPQVCFISADTTWPDNLIVPRIVNKGTDANPLYDRRTIEISVAIGEINISGTVIQYLNTNLVLMDMAYNGIYVKYPMSLFNEGLILPINY